MKVEPEVVIALIRAGAFAEEDNAATRLAGGSAIYRNGIDEAIVAPRIVRSHRIAVNLHERGFRLPVRAHVNPVLSTVAVEKVHDERTLECLSSAHLHHVVPAAAAVGDLCALVFNVRDDVPRMNGPWRSSSRFLP